MSDLVKHVIKSFNRSNTFQTKLPREIFELVGMSGAKTRILYNELCSFTFQGRPTEYLEVGSWKGSTLCAALQFNPHCNGTAIENWALFGGPKEEFDSNLNLFNLKDRVKVFEEDAFSLDISKISNKIDIYLYDGDHEETSHYKGITHFWPVLADQAIVIVDDWNWSGARQGTLNALNDVGANVIEKFEIMYTANDSHTPMESACREFWNGIAIFVVSKISK
jgi:predicted O-methyltransferase YrrM